MMEQVEIIPSKKDEKCKKMKEEIVFLKQEVDFLNKNLMSSQTLDDSLIHQRYDLDKSSLFYVGEFLSKNENASNNKDVRKRGGNVDAPSKGKSQVDIRINPTPRRNADGVKDERSNGYHQRIPRKNTSEVHEENIILPCTKLYFLVIVILIQTLGKLPKIVWHVTKTYLMVPINLREEIL